MLTVRRWLTIVTAAACLSCGAPPVPDGAEWTEMTSARAAVSLSLPPDLRQGDSFRLDEPPGEGLIFAGADDIGSVYVSRQLAIDAERANPDSTFARILSYTMDRLERGPGRPECASTSVGPVEGGEFYGRLAVWACPDDRLYLETLALSADRTVALRLDVVRPPGTDSEALTARILRSVHVDRDAVPLEVQAGGAVFGR